VSDREAGARSAHPLAPHTRDGALCDTAHNAYCVTPLRAALRARRGTREHPLDAIRRLRDEPHSTTAHRFFPY
jgi:hypothetical protein